MRKVIVILAVMLVSDLRAQSIERQVIAGAGATLYGQGLELDCTVGEVMIYTSQNANISLTQGFHQPLVIDMPCPGDFDNNGVINVADLLIFSGTFGCFVNCGLPDMDFNGSVNVADLLLFLAVFATSCP